MSGSAPNWLLVGLQVRPITNPGPFARNAGQASHVVRINIPARTATTVNAARNASVRSTASPARKPETALIRAPGSTGPLSGLSLSVVTVVAGRSRNRSSVGGRRLLLPATGG